MKTIALKSKRILFILPSLIFIALLLSTCDKKPIKTYYKIKGYGYAFDSINNKPLIGAKMMVYAGVEGAAGLLGNTNPNVETYTTDSNGYYEICFMKRYGTLKIVNYIFQLYYNAKGHEYIYEFSLDVDAEKNIFFAPILTPY